VIVGAAAPGRVHPGERIEVRLGLRLPHGPLRTLAIHVRVPRSLPLGAASMTVNGTPADGEPGGGGVDEFLGGAPPANAPHAPRTLKELAARVAAIHRFHGVFVTFTPAGRHQKARRVRVQPPSGNPTLRISGRAARRLRIG
jgi:hypothetical protein